MNENETTTTVNSLLLVIKSSLAADGSPAFGGVVLYTSFGVVRGRVGLAFAQRLLDRDGAQNGQNLPRDVIELNDVSVEHYSNHLPTAEFKRLYVRLSEVQGFALADLQGQA
jgi:hypothetical protein